MVWSAVLDSNGYEITQAAVHVPSNFLLLNRACNPAVSICRMDTANLGKLANLIIRLVLQIQSISFTSRWHSRCSTCALSLPLTSKLQPESVSGSKLELILHLLKTQQREYKFHFLNVQRSCKKFRSERLVAAED